MGLYQSTTRTFDLSANGKWVVVSPELVWVSVGAIAFVELRQYTVDTGLYTINLRFVDNSSSTRDHSASGTYETRAIDTLVSKPMPLAAAKAFVRRLTGGEH
jgi:hypothetical protein